jgi:hypothetical protein
LLVYLLQGPMNCVLVGFQLLRVRCCH